MSFWPYIRRRVFCLKMSTVLTKWSPSLFTVGSIQRMTIRRRLVDIIPNELVSCWLTTHSIERSSLEQLYVVVFQSPWKPIVASWSNEGSSGSSSIARGELTPVTLHLASKRTSKLLSLTVEDTRKLGKSSPSLPTMVCEDVERLGRRIAVTSMQTFITASWVTRNPGTVFLSVPSADAVPLVVSALIFVASPDEPFLRP